MAYTTRNTVNRLARKELKLNTVVPERSKEDIKPIHPDTSSSRNMSSIRYCKKHMNFSTQANSFLEVKLLRLRRKTYDGKHDTRDNNLPTVLANSYNHSHPILAKGTGYHPTKRYP